MSDTAWYVIHSAPRREAFVRDLLHDRGHAVFLPLLSERARGRRRSRTGPFFPGYLFARLSGTRGDLSRVRYTHGVRRILGDGGEPRPIDDRVVEALRSRSDRSGRVKIRSGLRPGDRVAVVDGPFAGFAGVLDRGCAPPEARVHVLLEMFRRVTRVELAASELRGRA